VHKSIRPRLIHSVGGPPVPEDFGQLAGMGGPGALVLDNVIRLSTRGVCGGGLLVVSDQATRGVGGWGVGRFISVLKRPGGAWGWGRGMPKRGSIGDDSRRNHSQKYPLKLVRLGAKGHNPLWGVCKIKVNLKPENKRKQRERRE